ncbi:hypothetical protein J6O48_12345 [bacterium]|nr:hypothetical protein [bacterium]
MKKIVILLFLLLFFVLGCYAQEVNNSEKKEIGLDINLPAKTYNLKKPSFNNSNNQSKVDIDDEEMPINFMPTPFQLLKQYQQDQL